MFWVFIHMHNNDLGVNQLEKLAHEVNKPIRLYKLDAYHWYSQYGCDEETMSKEDHNLHEYELLRIPSTVNSIQATLGNCTNEAWKAMASWVISPVTPPSIDQNTMVSEKHVRLT